MCAGSLIRFAARPCCLPFGGSMGTTADVPRQESLSGFVVLPARRLRARAGTAYVIVHDR